MAQQSCSGAQNAPGGARPLLSEPQCPAGGSGAPLWQLFLVFALLYAAFGVASPFLPAFVASRGITPEGIGVLFAAGTVIRLISAPLVGMLADHFQARRRALAICVAVAALATSLYQPASAFTAILLVALLHAAALAPSTNLADAIALVALGPRPGAGSKWRYGWVRGAGSAAFVAGAIAAGLTISVFGLAAVPWLQAALLMAASLAVRMMPSGSPAAANCGKTTVSAASVMALARMPAFRRAVLVAALILGSHAMHDTFSVIRWRSAHVAPATVSLLWSASVASEVVVFFLLGPYLLRKIGAGGAVAVAALAGALRWAVAGATADLAALALIQPLHGLTFALLHLACMRVIAATVPQQIAATAQAIYGTVGVGAATALLVLASGWLYARFGPHAFWVMSALCLAALPLAAGLHDGSKR
jgi:PPP family 3-phenylpropionic acid transporter